MMRDHVAPLACGIAITLAIMKFASPQSLHDPWAVAQWIGLGLLGFYAGRAFRRWQERLTHQRKALYVRVSARPEAYPDTDRPVPLPRVRRNGTGRDGAP